MKKKVALGFAAGVVVVLIGLFLIADDEPAKKPAAKPPAAAQKPAAPAPAAPAVAKPAPAPQAPARDYSRIITAEDLKNITGTAYRMKYADKKFSGDADFTFATTDEGHVVLTVTVLRASDYDANYNKFATQDYKAMEYAFWGPKNANPPRMLGFRKGNATIVLSRFADAGQYPLSIEMLEKIARSIAARL